MRPFSTDDELDALRQAIRTYAPSWEENGIKEILKHLFDGLPVTITTDSIGNLMITAGTKNPTILLASHLDTIASPLDFAENDEFMSGRGAVDCRASLFALALAMRRCIVKNSLRGSIIFVGIVAEEISTQGVETFLASFTGKPDAIIFGEPTNLTKICIGYKGRVWFDVKLEAKAGHVASAWLHVNGIEIIQELQKLISEKLASLVRKPDLSPFYTPRATITTLHAGSIPNMLPREASADIDIRFPPGMKKETVVGVVQSAKDAILEHYRKVDDTLEISINVKSKIDAIRVPTTGSLCPSMSRAIKDITGIDATFVKKTGSTFMNHIGNHFKIPIVTYGPGDPALEHTDQEHIVKQDFLNAINIIEKTVGYLFEDFFNVSSRSS